MLTKRIFVVCLSGTGVQSMSNDFGQTEMGGSNQRFHTTCWTEIISARTQDEVRQKEALNRLIQQCWKPVYCYLRQKGYSNDTAKDMTQGFFYEVVLGRDLIQQASRDKGKFRTFLLTALDRYATDIYRRDNAQKRSPDAGIVSLEMNDSDNLKVQAELDPDQIFNYTWASEILNRVLDEVREYCAATDRQAYWNVFNEKVIIPIIDGNNTPALSDLCEKYGISDEAKVSNMIAYVKGKFRSTMMQCLRQFVESEAEIEEEFNALFKILSNKATR
jgi:RNA polymerase sigma-70 factor (ECF subfamily)